MKRLHILDLSSARNLAVPPSRTYLLLLRADSLVKMKASASRPVFAALSDLPADASSAGSEPSFSARCTSCFAGEGVPGGTSGWGRGCKRRGPIALKKGGVFSLSFLGGALCGITYSDMGGSDAHIGFCLTEASKPHVPSMRLPCNQREASSTNVL